MKAKKEIRVVTLTKSQDTAYGNLMSAFLNSGFTDLKAEKETLKELRKRYPSLRKKLRGNYKIAV